MTENTVQDAERAAAFEKARELGITFSNNISTEKLLERIADAEEDAINAPVVVPAAVTEAAKTAPTAMTAAEREAKFRHDMKMEAMALKRVRIDNLNPAKADLEGEYFSVGNDVIGNVRRFVPYGEKTHDGWHVPQILLEHLKERQFQHIKTKRDPRTGLISVETSMRTEFQITEMPPLSQSEINALAAAQAGLE